MTPPSQFHGPPEKSSPSNVFEETATASKLIYQGRVIALRQDTVMAVHGQTTTREVVEHPGGVCVLPVHADGSLVMVRQFRYPLGQALLEFPAGKLDVAGESPLQAAQRELAEETGLQAQHWEAWGFVYTAPGFCNEKIYLFKATGLSQTKALTADNEEAIDIITLNWPQVKALLAQGQLTDAKSLALLALYQQAGLTPG